MRMGFVQIGETLHRIYLVESDSDALFTNTWELMVGVDTDGNGMPTLDMASPEWFTRGWPLDFAGFVQISNHYYCVVDVSPDGRSIELAGFESSLTPLPTLLPGYSAPSFTALTAAGDPFTVGDPFESPVLLLFAPIAQLFPETFDPCADRGWLGSVACIEGYFRPVSGAFRELARTQAVLTYAEELQAAYDLEIVLVATDINWLSENDRNVAAALDLPISLLWDEAPMNRYRTTYYNAILIDDRGLIVARDSVIPRYDESGHLLESESDVLTLLEIGEFLESMAGREDP
jgi:hypothetical protein